MPTMPSSTRSTVAGSAVHDPAAGGRSAARPVGCARSGASSSACTAAPRPGQPRAREQRVATVVARRRPAAAPGRRRPRPASASSSAQRRASPAAARVHRACPPAGSQHPLLGRTDVRRPPCRSHAAPSASIVRRAQVGLAVGPDRRASVPFGDDHGRGDAAVVRQREVPAADRRARPRPRHRARDGQPRPAVGVGDDLAVVPVQPGSGRRAPWPPPPWPRTGPPATPASAGCPTRCALGLGEQPVGQQRRTRQRPDEPLDQHDVHAHRDDHSAA